MAYYELAEVCSSLGDNLIKALSPVAPHEMIPFLKKNLSGYGFFHSDLKYGSDHKLIRYTIKDTDYITWNTMPLITPMKSFGRKTTFYDYFPREAFENIVCYKAYIVVLAIILNCRSKKVCIALSEVDEYIANYLCEILKKLYGDINSDFVPQFTSATSSFNIGYLTITTFPLEKELSSTRVRKLVFEVLETTTTVHERIEGTRCIFYSGLNLYNVHFATKYVIDDFKNEIKLVKKAGICAIFMGDFNVRDLSKKVSGIKILEHDRLCYIVSV